MIWLYFSKYLPLYVLVDDIQLSCYRILTSLYSLGSGKNIYVEKYKKNFTSEGTFFFWWSYPFLLEIETNMLFFTDSCPRWVNVYLPWLEPCLLLSWNPT